MKFVVLIFGSLFLVVVILVYIRYRRLQEQGEKRCQDV